MAKIYSVKAELSVLRGLFHKKKEVAGTLLAGIDSTYFYREEAVEIYEAVKASMTEDGDIPKFRLMVEDPSLSDDARTYLRDSMSVINNTADAKKALKVLQKYRLRRGLHSVAHKIAEDLQKPRADGAQIMAEALDALTRAQQSKSTKDSFLNFGKRSNSKDFVKAFLFEPPENRYIPTGIEAFDDVNGGFFRKSLVIEAGNSGAGKSHLMLAKAKRQVELGYKVLVVPLEMSAEELFARLVASISGIDSLKFMTGKTTQKEKEKAYRRYTRWEKKCRLKGGVLSIFKPDADLTIEEVYAAASAYPWDVTYIDYISLLAGMDDDNQWRKLGAAARYGKINAELNDRVNVLLAQANDTGALKYSQTMREHANNLWIFVADEDTKDQGILRIIQAKSRSQSGHPFSVGIDYVHSRISKIGTTDSDSKYNETETTGKPKKKRRDELRNLAAPDV